MADLLQTLMAAVAVGGLYALIALGYTMVYGILKFINFAHSDIVVLGAWVSFRMARDGLPFLHVDPQKPPLWAGGLVLVLAMLACGVAGFLIERLAYRPLRRASRLNVLITAIGISLLLQNVGQLPFVFGTQPVAMPMLLPDAPLVTLNLSGGTVVIGLVDVAIIATSAVLMVLLEFLVYRTKMGSAMRAVSFNTETAALVGINVDRVISTTFVIGSALAAAAGFLYSMKYASLKQPADAVWVLLGLKAFVAAVIGGIGNIRGAVVGGFVIAFVELFGAFYLGSSYRDVYVFALLILVLLVRPTGILGKTTQDKV